MKKNTKPKAKTAAKTGAKATPKLSAKNSDHRSDNSEPTLQLRLYVAGQTPKSLAALSNLKQICSDHVDGKYEIKVIDLVRNPQLAQGDQILAIPTLVRSLPQPIRKIIGDLSNVEKVLVGLNLRDPEGDGVKSKASAKGA